MSNEVRSHRSWHALPDWFRGLAAEQRGAVLLETAKFDDENFRTYLFLEPICELIAQSQDDVADVFLRIDEHAACGHYVAGFVSYECGYILHRLSHFDQRKCGDVPLIHMGVFHAPLIFNHRDGILEGHKAAVHSGAHSEDRCIAAETTLVKQCDLDISENDYVERVERVQQYLAAGHSYQVNFTDRVADRFDGAPCALYRQLIDRQPVAYAAYLDCGDYQILSLSPELFYRATDHTISVKPMKGTWARGINLEDDRRAADELRHDPKNCAEHVTIVDLLRNDLGQVCVLGSVKVDRLMEVERYRTLHQMTSTISGVPEPQKTPSQLFRALFPSGSITGAPKRRTMEIIRELERSPRGVYTGAIGWFGPDRQACFNVAIRTLTIRKGRFTLGVGGGITVDSEPREEYRECQLKASFLQGPGSEFHLIETMRAFDGHIPLLDGHMKRLRESAEYFQMEFNEQALKGEIARLLMERGESEWRVRVTLDGRGRADIQDSILDPAPWTGRLMLSSERTNASDIFLFHKTSRRRGYDAALAEARRSGFDEVLFLNQDGFLTEGAISNIFLLVQGVLVTPAIRGGVLPGVQRAHILESMPQSHSTDVTIADLLAADQIWMCNALRGSRPVSTICDSLGNVLWRSHRYGSIGVLGG